MYLKGNTWKPEHGIPIPHTNMVGNRMKYDGIMPLSKSINQFVWDATFMKCTRVEYWLPGKAGNIEYLLY